MKKYLLLILILGGAGIWLSQDTQAPTVDSTATVLAPKIIDVDIDAGPYVKISELKIPVEVARTEAEVQKGLLGRESLDADKGMLFIFNKPDYYRFWMPDMNFPIDIIWITQDEIVGIHQNVSSVFDPKNPKFYLPPRPVSMVLEVNAGFAQKNNFRVGDEIIFYNIP